jgi:hypothetical protein
MEKSDQNCTEHRHLVVVTNSEDVSHAKKS